jgi:WD40 repeat protein
LELECGSRMGTGDLTSPPEQVFTGGHDMTIKSWNTKTGKTGMSYAAHTALVTGFAATSDNGFFSSSLDGNVVRWKIGVKEPIETIRVPGNGIRHMLYFPERKLLACGCIGGVLRLITEHDDREFRELFIY